MPDVETVEPKSPGIVATPKYEAGPSYDGTDIQWDYIQPIPSIMDPVKWYFTDFGSRTKDYLISLLPIMTWIHRYNLRWLYGDLIAGLTVGVVVVPQGMSYAKVAGLPVQYGLYSSFIGVMLYCLFATSKDVSIGPVAVMSAETYKITHRVLHDIPSLSEKDLPMIAGVLSLLCGAITFGIGILRLGFILEYIPMPAVLGFMTGSAFTIAAGQVPGLMGINKLFDTRAASYKVVINTLKHLGSSNVNAAFGLVSLFLLYALKYGCGYLEKKDKKRKWLWFYLNTLRAAIVVIGSTLISWGCYRIYGKTKISMIGNVPRGLKDVGVHPVNSEVASKLAESLPIATVVLVLEHIAIAKSFGRINEYRINPNQELIAIGISNMVGHFFQAYPNTGSFSRTALKSKCGVRTPLAGIFTGICVLVAIYALTDAFKFISNAALAAIIINAVGDLMASFQTSIKIFLVSPVEWLIFIIDVFLCVFVTLEAGIYFSVAASLVLLLLKQTFPLGEFLGKVEFTRHAVSLPQDIEVEDPPATSRLDDIRAASASAIKVPAAVAKTYKQKLSDIVHKRRADKHRGNVFREQDESQMDESFEKSKGDNVHARSLAASSESTTNGFGGIEHSEHFDNMLSPSGPGEPEKEITKPVVLNPDEKIVKWWPLSHNGVNPNIRIVPPPPGIFVYRLRESLTYQNAAWQAERLVDYMHKHTRRNLDHSIYKNQKLGDRPWNERGPRKYKPPSEADTRPILRAIVFDMSCSPNVDLTGAQALWDCHQELTKYACVPVEFHFAGILSPWARRALLSSGFGGDSQAQPPHTDRLVELSSTSADPEAQLNGSEKLADYVPVTDTTNCYFHFDIPDLAYVQGN